MTLVERWHLYATREGILAQPELVNRLPRTCRVSGDGKWAELDSGDGSVDRVFIKLAVRSATRRREGVAW